MLPKLAGVSATSDRERLALEFAVRYATDHTGIDDALMNELRQHFTDAEVVELGLVVGTFVMIGRLHHVFGVPPLTAGAGPGADVFYAQQKHPNP